MLLWGFFDLLETKNGDYVCQKNIPMETKKTWECVWQVNLAAPLVVILQNIPGRTEKLQYQ
jgi:glutathione synthase/RimK-type ligase-like ATP-grasp enzyme